MANIILNSNSTTLYLNGRALSDFVDGDTLTLTPVNALSSQLRSGNGINLQKRSDGDVYDLLFRIPKYSDDDDFMLEQINKSDLEVFNGSVVESYKKDGQNRVRKYIFESGSITTQPTETKNNLDGNNLREYTIRINNVIAS